MKDQQHTIEIERGAPDRLLPKDFSEVLMRRYFPALSLTYIASVIGVAANKGEIVHYVFEDKSAYIIALFVAMWVSIPAVLWILLKGSHMFSHTADNWYKVTAGIMTSTLLISFVLFPDIGGVHLRTYLVASIPVMFIMYFLFVKGGLPGFAAYPLTALGLTFLLYGGVINFLY